MNAVVLRSLVLATLGFCTASAASGEDVKARRLGSDVFVAGDEVRLSEEVAGDALLAGGEVDFDGTVGGDAVVAGGRVRIDGTIRDDLYASGGEVRIGARIDGSARVAGGEVEFDESSNVAGGLTVGGGEVSLNGSVGRYAQVGGGRVRINGTVAGDVDVAAGELRVGPDAVIEGTLTYRGREAPRVASGAQIRGGVKHIPRGPDERGLRALFGFASLVWLIGWIIIGVLLIALAPAAVSRVAETLRTRPWAALLSGLAVLIAAPIVMVILTITLIGIPLALLLLFAYLALIGIGYLASIATLADVALMRRRAAAAPSRGMRIVAFAVAAIVIYLLMAIPVIGGLLWFLLVTFGMGAIVQSVRPGPRATVATP